MAMFSDLKTGARLLGARLKGSETEKKAALYLFDDKVGREGVGEGLFLIRCYHRVASP